MDHCCMQKSIVKKNYLVYGRRKQARTLTQFRNAVPLVWGSLMLAPIGAFQNPPTFGEYL